MTMLLGTRRSLFQVGGAAWTPALPTGDGGVLPDHWYRSDQGLWQDAGVTPAASDGDVVGRWEDITANADHANQANAGNKPTLQNGAGDLLNGWSVVRSDGIDDVLLAPFTTGGAIAQPFDIFMVAKLDAAQIADGQVRYLIEDAAAAIAGLAKLNTNAWIEYAGVILSGGAADAAWNIWTAQFSGATSRFWHNGIAECAAGNAGAQNISGFAIGANNGAGQPSKTDFAEVLTYSSTLSTADKNQVGQYLALRYGLTYTDI